MSTTPSSVHESALYDLFRDGARRLVDRAFAEPNGKPTRLGRTRMRVRDAIAAHPITALALAFGMGYVVSRIAQRVS